MQVYYRQNGYELIVIPFHPKITYNYFSSVADFAHKDKEQEWHMPFANVVVKKYLKPVDRFVDLHVGCFACWLLCMF